MKVAILQLKGILLASLQAELTDEDVLGFQADLARKVTVTEAKGVVIDITALDVVDSFMARVINESAHMTRLLGAEIVVCGMQPAVALTLIEMGRELIDVETALNLDHAMEHLQRRLASRESGSPTEGEDAGP